MADVITITPDSGGRCGICSKTFLKESTLKRHKYYCRSKRPEANASRRRSCTACMRAKTRCTWLMSIGSQTCTRCSERSIKCEFDSKPRQDLVSIKDNQSSASTSPRRGASDRRIQRITPSTSPSKTYIAPEEFSVGAYAPKYPNVITAFNTVLDDNWNVEFGDFTAFDPYNTPLANRELHAVSNTVTTLGDTLVTGITALDPASFQTSTSQPFNSRAVTKTTHGSLLTFATRILRSYPYMILQNETFPPFLSAQLYNWGKTGQGPRQQALVNCVSLIQIFKSRTEQNKSLIWRLIKSEQERILEKHLEFDQWELLATLQALLLYCLLRLHDVPGEHEGFDASLLKTVNAVSDTLCARVTCDCSLPSDPDLAWRDWLFNESRRRTALVFRAINMLVDISEAMTCYPVTGFGLIPLPCNSTLWGSQDVGKWKTAFAHHCNERILYSLSENGALVKLQAGEAGIHQSAVPWEEWNPAVGEIGTLVMIMGELLS